MTVKSFWTAGVIALTMTSLAQATAQTADQRPAVLGVRLGMSQAEATAALKAANPRLGFTSRALKTPSGASFVYQLTALSRADGQNAGEHLILLISPPSTGAKVVTIDRTWSAPVNQPAAWSNIVSSLRAKHGKEVTWRVDSRDVTGWFFGAKGNPIPPPAAYTRCAMHRGPAGAALNFLMSYDASKMTDAQLENLTNVPSACSSWLFVSPDFLQGDLTKTFRVQLFDKPAYFGALRNISLLVNADATAKQNSQERNAQQRGAPPL